MKLSSILDIFGYQKLYGVVKTLHFQQFFKERFQNLQYFVASSKTQLFLMTYAQLDTSQ